MGILDQLGPQGASGHAQVSVFIRIQSSLLSSKLDCGRHTVIALVLQPESITMDIAKSCKHDEVIRQFRWSLLLHVSISCTL